MSSKFVRDEVKNFISTNLIAGEPNVVDLTAEFSELRELLDLNGITRNDQWIGLQFIGNEEEPITISATNTTGKYREVGAVYIHVVDVAAIGVGNKILNRSEIIRNAFRGRRISDKIKILSITPPNFEAGATLQFEAGWTSASVILSYEYDIDI